MASSKELKLLRGRKTVEITNNYRARISISVHAQAFTSSKDPDFAAALLLYVRNTTADIRTDTNEISYWLEEFTERFGPPFYVFGFYRDRELVGYAEAAYFSSQGLLALDYIVIDELHRRNNVFYEFLDHLKRFLEDAHPGYRYGIAEVGYGSSQDFPTKTTRLLTRLLKLQGFRVLKAPYYQPRLTFDDAETEMRADLLIYSTASIESVCTETYLGIVRTLYYDYYLAWKANAPISSQRAYKQYLDKLYSRIEGDVQRKKTILVNGHQTFLAAPTENPGAYRRGIVAFSFTALVIIVAIVPPQLEMERARLR